MSNIDERLESLNDSDLDTLIARLKRKPRMAMEKMQEEFQSEFNDSERRITNIARDIYTIREEIASLKFQAESLTSKPPKIDTSKVPNEWESNRAFNKRWPWIEIDQSSGCVKCKRCGQMEMASGFAATYSDNFQWFVNTHGACPDPNKKANAT